MSVRYQQSLSSLIDFSDLPDALGIIQNVVPTLFDNFYFDNYSSIISQNGSNYDYNIDIILPESLGFNILNTGITFVINPDDAGGNPQQTVFTIQFSFYWKILAFLKAFDISQFASDATAYFNLLMNLFTDSDQDFSNSSLDNLIEGDFSDGDTDSGDGNYDYFPDPSADADQPDLPPIADDSVEFDPDTFYENQPVIPNYCTNQFATDILAKYPNVFKNSHNV